MSTGTAVSPNGNGQKSQLSTIKGALESPQFRDAIAKALPTHMTADRFLRIAVTATLRTPKLMDCTQASLLNCLLQLSQFGLEPDGRHAHLIPYGKDCTLIIDYKGLVSLVLRSGMVSTLHADLVCENDDFEYDKGFIVRHKIDFRQPRGKVYAVYCVCRLKDGTEKSEVMTRDDVEAIRSRSKAGRSGPWVTDWNEMAKKTVFRRLSKWLPLSPEIRDAMDGDDDRVGEQLPSNVLMSTATTVSKSDQLAEMLASRGGNDFGNAGDEPSELSQVTDPDRGEESQVEPEPESAEALLERINLATTIEEVKAIDAAINKIANEKHRIELSACADMKRREIQGR